MMDLLYVDVFGNGAFTGNPLAVVKAEATLDARQMQTVAAWLNLSETAFLLPPEDRLADYRVRIFTPRQELSFAGHPSVGAAWAAIHWRLMPSEGGLRMQQCGAGLLPVRVDDPSTHPRIHVKSPTARLQTTIEPQRLLEMTRTALGTPLVGQAQIVDVGAVWLLANLGQSNRVRALQPNLSAVASLTSELGCVGIAVFGRETLGAAALAVRAFCPGDGIAEDPVTGSANAAIGTLLHATGQLPGPRYEVSQGREIGRDGHVLVEVENDGTVWIGGACTTCIEGFLEYPTAPQRLTA